MFGKWTRLITLFRLMFGIASEASFRFIVVSRLVSLFSGVSDYCIIYEGRLMAHVSRFQFFHPFMLPPCRLLKTPNYNVGLEYQKLTGTGSSQSVYELEAVSRGLFRHGVRPPTTVPL